MPSCGFNPCLPDDITMNSMIAMQALTKEGFAPFGEVLDIEAARRG